MLYKRIKLLLCAMSLISFLFIASLAEEIAPKRPETVLKEAKWERVLSLWSYGERLKGNKILWYKDGTFLYREILINKNLKKSMRYHEKGKIQKIGQWQYFKNKYYDNDGNLIGWIEIGKWKEYDEEGNLVHEWCLTPNPNKGGEEPQKCGEEKFFNNDGAIKEKIQHKLDCKYGCGEVECKDCITEQK